MMFKLIVIEKTDFVRPVRNILDACFAFIPCEFTASIFLEIVVEDSSEVILAHKC